MKKTALILLMVLLISMTGGGEVVTEASDSDFRAVWVSSVVNLDFPSKQGLTPNEMKNEIDAIIKRTSEIGLNAIILQVRPSGDALYKSEIYPWSVYLTGAQGVAPIGGFDPLAYWIEQAHNNGLELHAWINPYRITHTASRITDVTKLAPSNPARLNPSLAVQYNGALYYDPGLPENKNLILDGVSEIIDKYNVDGIHLDDYFYPGPDFDDNASYAKYGGGKNRDDWRRENVNDVIKGIRDRIKAANPDIRFGVSPFAIWQNSSSTPLGSDTKGFESYKSIYSDSRRWVLEGWLDYICPQIYWYIGYNVADYQKVLNWWVDLCKGTDVDLYVGHAAYKELENEKGWSSGEILRQLKMNNDVGGVSGSVFFRSAYLTGSLGEQLKGFYGGVQSQPAEVMNKMAVTQPSANISVTGATGYTIFGTCDPTKVLYMNGVKITNVTAEGFFSVYATLNKGDNTFIFTQVGQNIIYRTITVNEPAAPQLETMNLPAVSKAFPLNDAYVSLGDSITLRCTAPVGAVVTANINGETISLSDDNPNRDYGSDKSKIYSTTYSRSYKVAGGGDVSKVTDLGAPVYTASYNNQTYKSTAGGKVRIIGAEAPYYAVVESEAAWIYPQASSNGGSSWQLLKGQKDRVTAISGDWARLSSGKWIDKNSVSLTMENNIINNALSEGFYSSTGDIEALVWRTSHYPAVDVQHEGNQITIHFGMQTELPKIYIPVENDIIFDGFDNGFSNGTPYYKLKIRDGANMEGFYSEFSGGEFRINFKKRKSLSQGNVPLLGFKFVIDAGHGMSDSGAIGPMGSAISEKDINLSNALKLSDRLKELGATVVMVRDKDVFYTLAERTEISRVENPDMFISIHANSMPETTDSSNIRGLTVWYRNQGSAPLAKTLMETLHKVNPLTTRSLATNQSNFYVCRPSWTPSVIIEASFMCNIDDFSWLINESNQDKLAEETALAILRYYSPE